MLNLCRRAVAPVTSALRAMSTRPAHGGVLTNLMVDDAKKAELIKKTEGRTIELTDRQSCDVELLVNGGFSPLTGFMSEADYTSVVKDMRMTNNLLFGLPVVMDTDREDLKPGMSVLLQYKGQDIASMDIAEKFVPNKPLEAQECYGTTSIEHPGVRMITGERGRYYISGDVHGFELPKRVFPCKTAREVRDMLPDDKDVVVFQCRNPIHRAHYELFTRSLDAPNVGKDSLVLVHPTCGPTQEEDIQAEARYKTYLVLADELKNDRILWAYLPYSMHMAGPREAVQHIIIRKNFGASHFIVGRDMAGSKSSLTGDDYYGAYDAQEMAAKHAEELGMQTVPSPNLAYTQEKGYMNADEAKELGLKPLKLSGTEFRRRLRAGEEIPTWFAFESVVKVLREA